MLGRVAVMSAVYERIERIGSSQRADAYIHPCRKIKDKSVSRQQYQVNEMIVAQPPGPQLENCAETTLLDCAAVRQ
jgi:hypothetical protein